MTKEELVEKNDYSFIDKLREKNERQLKAMLSVLGKDIAKLKAEQDRINNKLEQKIKKEHFVKDALIEKWRTPNEELLVAIKEIENGESTVYDNVEEMMEDIKNSKERINEN